MDRMEQIEQDEEINFRKWLRSLDRQPVEVDGDDQWNEATIDATIDYVFGFGA